MKRKLRVKEIPAFVSEADEAKWWHKNREKLDKSFVDAARRRDLKRMDQKTLRKRVSASAKVISIRLPEADLELARKQAAEKGLPYQTYIKSVLHQALTRTR